MSEFEDFGDSYSYEEEYSEPIIPVEYNLDDDSQMFHSDQLNEKPIEEILEPPPIPVYDDNSTAFCTSIEQARNFISKSFNIHPSSLRSAPIVGLVILSIKDYNLIRKDHRHNRTLPHLLVVPVGDNFQLAHPEFAQCIQILHKPPQ